jgi:hypothetical protein
MNWSDPTEKVRTWMASLLEWVWLPSLTSIGVPADQLPPFWGKITPARCTRSASGPPARTAATPTARRSRYSASWLSLTRRARHP